MTMSPSGSGNEISDEYGNDKLWLNANTSPPPQSNSRREISYDKDKDETQDYEKLEEDWPIMIPMDMNRRSI